MLNNGASASLSATATIDIPNVATGGTYYIIVLADANHFQSESNEDNNFSVHRVQVTAPQYTLTTNAIPANGGSLSGSGTYAAGSQVSVIANANPGWRFAGWSGQCAGFGSCLVTMDSNKSVTATFSQQQYVLVPTASPANGGSISGGGAGRLLWRWLLPGDDGLGQKRDGQF